MNLMQRSATVLGASALAVGLAVSTAGVANAKDITINANLTDVSGPVTSGSNSTGPGNVSAQLDFTVPSGQLGSDATDLAGSSNPVDFTNQISGDINGTPIPGLSGTLNASNTFSDGPSLADFLLGNSDYVTFDDATLEASGIGSLALDDPQGQVTNPTFSGSTDDLTTLTGGTLLLSGNNGTLASLNVDGSLDNGNGSVTASGTVGGNPPPPPPPPGEVPAPSGIAMLLFMGIAVGGMGFARRRKSKGGSMLAA